VSLSHQHRRNLEQFSRLPWMVPVPVRQAAMASLRARHRHLGIEIDLSRITPFSTARGAIARRDLLFADLQTNADANVVRRLGSGRAGLYRGFYLKGVGRTSLAANWNDPDDRFHSTGLMQPSAALRELLVSWFLSVRGAGHLVTPCTGLLLRPLRHLARGTFGLSRRRFRPADRTWRAISVKEGAFSRFSNLLWYLDHLAIEDEATNPLGTFFEGLWNGLHRTDEARPPSADAGEVARRLAAVVAATIERFLEAWSLGVHWGSLHNNFTLDGRFLDLETATILPRPLVGSWLRGDPDGPPVQRLPVADWNLGFEVMSYARQLRTSIRIMASRLRELAVTGRPAERAFIGEFLHELASAMADGHPLSGPRALAAKVIARIGGELDLGSSELKLVRSVCEEKAFRAFHPKADRHAAAQRKLTLHRVPIRSGSPNQPGLRVEVLVPGFLRDRAEGWIPENLAFNAAMNRAEYMTRTDELLSFLAETELAWRRGATPHPSSRRGGDA
jgi:hypothetical protein